MKIHGILIIFLLITTLALGFYQFSANPGPGMPAPRSIQFNPQGAGQLSPSATLQNSVDRVSEAALNGQWSTAASEVNRLERTWQTIKPNRQTELIVDDEIERLIQNLHFNVWGRDVQGVLNTGQQLTSRFSQLTS